MGNFTVVPDVVTGQSFPPSLWESAIMNNLNLGVCRQLGDTTLTVNAATVAFSSIPATFAHLLVAYTGRGDVAALSCNILAQFNGDSGANYDYQYLQGNGTSALAGQAQASTSILAGLITAATATAGIASGGLIFIPGYAGATFQKHLVSLSSMKQSTATGGQYMTALAGFWRNAAAISTLTLLPSSGNFIAGTRFTLYGFPS